AALDRLALLRRQRLRMREVEAELVRADGRARLAYVVAELVLERLVQEVRRGVVRHRREADVPRNDRADARPELEPVAAKGQHLVVLEPDRLHELRARARLLVLDVAGVGDLAAALRVE